MRKRLRKKKRGRTVETIFYDARSGCWLRVKFPRSATFYDVRNLMTLLMPAPCTERIREGVYHHTFTAPKITAAHEDDLPTLQFVLNLVAL